MKTAAKTESEPHAVPNPESVAKLFMRRLREAETTRDVKVLSALFSGDASLENLTRPAMHHGGSKISPNAESFWRQYLAAFEHVESNFVHVLDDGQMAVLEWHSSGRLSMGLAVEYNGVSILEYAGGEIKKFRTYYDSAALLPHSSKSDRHYSESVGLPDITTEAGS